DVRSGVPAVAATISIAGYIQESRMVGTALYVASQFYRPITNGAYSTWEWGTVVSSFDLSDPAKPATRGTLWNSGYSQVVMATDCYLFVATDDTNNWQQSIVQCIDISAPDGTMRTTGSIRTVGRVKDKFKMNLNGDIFTSITEEWRTNWVTTLENFSLANPSVPRKLGQLEIGRGEQLF